ncbi:cation diffusion facilitator family transporter [Pedococcus bigeumensis]|uniref:Cation transporter n=1 Tax=Pedococcus bigeumensis TaxID=433644 RepID=A0A502CYD7_9MICO|nr:cation diffusion facilitator family transporter [Pedococcus bigeumensis]TPG16836.1 cation transporter [Pedococcus bigeumensis]
MPAPPNVPNQPHEPRSVEGLHGHEHAYEGEPVRDHDHDHDHQHGWLGRARHVFTPHSHDAADSVDDALESSARGIRAVKVSLVGLALTAVLQLLVFLASGSVALLADTIHNFSDAFTAIPLWVAFWLGRRPPTRRYTYGFGRAEDLAGLFVILMIATSAVLAGWEAVRRLLEPAPVHNLGWVALAGFVGFLGNEAVAAYRIREGNAIGSAALVAEGHHARTDGLTSLAVLVGAGGVAVGWNWADPLVGLLITVAIVMVLRTAAREVFRRLMDGVEPDKVEAAQNALVSMPHVVGVRDLRMRWVGHELLADVTLDVETGVSAAAAHDLAHEAQQHMVAAVPRLRRAVVHAYPAAVEGGQLDR